ncbi:MAG: hypothetical protein WBE08_06535 [Methyloceanibacter sp.]|jgi:hypothetical protein
MTNRMLFIGAATGALMLAAFSSQAFATPAGSAGASQIDAGAVQLVGYRYNRRGVRVWAPFTDVDTRRGTYVRAPFARVYSGRRGTWVRAPFVDLWVPRR